MGQKGFTSVLAWLNADEGNEQTENALFVLDLAELASVRLLQKHKLPIKKSQQQNSRTNKDYIASDERRIHNLKPLAQFLRKTGFMLSKIRTRLKSILFQS